MPENSNTECNKNDVTNWRRPELPEIDENTHDLTFQTIDIEFLNSETPKELRTRYDSYGSTLRLFGVTPRGNTVLVTVFGFRPHFYVEAPSQFDADFLPALRQTLNKLVLAEVGDKGVTEAVLAIELELKSNLYGFQNNKKSPFFKITVATQTAIGTCRKVLEHGFSVAGTNYVFPRSYESNIDFEIRFLVEMGLSGCNWARLDPGKYIVARNERNSHCQLEVSAAWESLRVLDDPEWDTVAPYRVLSYDIECCARKGVFPEASIDPVIQIANAITIYGSEDHVVRVVFTLGTCAPIVGARVVTAKNEKELLRLWAEFILETDPDVITGYNIFNFDTPYLIERAEKIGVKEVLHLGRLRHEVSRVRTTTFQNRAFGRRDNKSVNISGRLQLDVLQILLREHKLRSYTLNNVSFHFLGEQKEDVHHSIIADLQNGDEFTRRRLAQYCLKDALLPLQLLNKLMIVTNHVEMARVTGVPLNFLLKRGQQVKVVSQLLRSCKTEDLVIPTVNASSGEEFEGATVIEPAKGYYDTPIATLDFVSLYPSIMICYNLCYSTLLTPIQAKNMSPDDYNITPCGNYFVKKHVREGILPSILKNLLDARKNVKTMLKNEKDPLKRRVYDGRQLAIKISANSVYGFTGAQVGRLPCLEISGSVTAFGRSMIERTKNIVENKYCTANNYKFNARVIYGDTDSVMIKFGTGSLEEAMTLAKEAAKFVSSEFPDPIKLEFEKVYFPYLLINKKRYAGLLYTNPLKHDKIDCKGIETVRRDNCLLVANLVSSCLYKILIERDPNGAVKLACDTISDLLMNKIDISLLIISKELRKTGENYTNKQPHSELAERMRKRDAGSAPKLGDRVPFVYIMGSKKDRAYEKTEDPIYVLDNNIPIDSTYYLENQLAKPLTRLFEPILGEKTTDTLLKGQHTLNRSVTTSAVGLLSKYTSKKATCIGCKSTIENSGKSKALSNALCSFCDPNFKSIYLDETTKMMAFQSRCNSLWTECQRCQGSYTEEVICTNRDCPIFYMRVKVLKDIDNQTKILRRFDYLTN